MTWIGTRARVGNDETIYVRMESDRAFCLQLTKVAFHDQRIISVSIGTTGLNRVDLMCSNSALRALISGEYPLVPYSTKIVG